jgi:hypothetical protein
MKTKNMNSLFQEALEQARTEPVPLHLGPSENLERALDLAFTANREAITTELNLLRGNARVCTAATWLGLALLTAGILLIYARKIEVGLVSSAIGIFAEVVPLLVFRRLERSRQEIRRRLPSYGSLYAMLVTLEVGDPEARAEVLAVLKGNQDS